MALVSSIFIVDPWIEISKWSGERKEQFSTLLEPIWTSESNGILRAGHGSEPVWFRGPKTHLKFRSYMVPPLALPKTDDDSKKILPPPLIMGKYVTPILHTKTLITCVVKCCQVLWCISLLNLPVPYNYLTGTAASFKSLIIDTTSDSQNSNL